MLQLMERTPYSFFALANKKYNDDDLNNDTTLSFNEAPENYLKVSVGNDVYILLKMIRYELPIKQKSNNLIMEDTSYRNRL